MKPAARRQRARCPSAAMVEEPAEFPGGDPASALPPHVQLRQWGPNTFGVYLVGGAHHRFGCFVAVMDGDLHQVSSYADTHVRVTRCCTTATVVARDDTREGSGSERLSVRESTKAKPGRQPRGLAAAFQSDRNSERSAVDDDVT